MGIVPFSFLTWVKMARLGRISVMNGSVMSQFYRNLTFAGWHLAFQRPLQPSPCGSNTYSKNPSWDDTKVFLANCCRRVFSPLVHCWSLPLGTRREPCTSPVNWHWTTRTRSGKRKQGRSFETPDVGCDAEKNIEMPYARASEDVYAGYAITANETGKRQDGIELRFSEILGEDWTEKKANITLSGRVIIVRKWSFLQQSSNQDSQVDSQNCSQHFIELPTQLFFQLTHSISKPAQLWSQKLPMSEIWW